MIDVATENLLTLPQAAALLPTRPHVASIYRWIARGVDGRRLEAVRVAGKTLTSREALARFAQPINGNGTQTHDAPSTRRAEAAERELDAVGI